MKSLYALAIAAACSLSASQIGFAQEELAVVKTVSTLATSTSEAFLNPLHQQEWVTLDADGSITGQFKQWSANGAAAPVGNAEIKLLVNGKLVDSTTANEKGEFSFSKLPVGTYALMGRSESSLAIFALHVLPQAAAKNLDSHFLVFGSMTPGNKVEEMLRSQAVPGSDAIYPIFDKDPLGDARRFNGESKVQLRGTTLVGRISRPNGLDLYDLSDNSIRIVRAGKTLASTFTNTKGEFQIPEMKAGIYDLVVVGKDGMAVGSFQAIESPTVAKLGRDAGRSQLVTAQGGCPDCLNVETVSCSECVASDSLASEQYIDPAMAPIPGGAVVGPEGFPGGGFAGGGGAGGGGFGGGGFGGGGGGGLGGGLGGIGGLLGIGGLAVGVAALAANDDGFNVNPASVIVP